MKIVLVIALSLIITIFSGANLNDLNNATKNVEEKDSIVDEEIVSDGQNVVNEQNEKEEKKEEKQKEQVASNEEKQVKKEETKQTTSKTQQKETSKETNKNSSTQTTIKNEKKTESKKNQSVATVQEEKKENVVDITKKEEKTTYTEKDLEYWCVEGGKNHIAGTEENEHGYYSTWDEAYKAFEIYTKDWASVQFKVDQCPCGLYYFWAIQ